MTHPDSSGYSLPERCVIVIDQTLPAGKAANAAAVLALTLGQRHPDLVGAPLVDADGNRYAGLIPIGISVLQAPADSLASLLGHARANEIDCIVFPVDGQQTTDYAALQAMVATRPADSLELLGVAFAGRKKIVRKLTADMALLG